MDRVEMRLIEITLRNAVARGALDEDDVDAAMDGMWNALATFWTCIGSVDCLRLRTVRGKESIATNKPGLPTGVSPRSYPAG